MDYASILGIRDVSYEQEGNTNLRSMNTWDKPAGHKPIMSFVENNVARFNVPFPSNSIFVAGRPRTSSKPARFQRPSRDSPHRFNRVELGEGNVVPYPSKNVPPYNHVGFQHWFDDDIDIVGFFLRRRTPGKLKFSFRCG